VEKKAVTSYFSYIGDFGKSGDRVFLWEPPDEKYQIFNLPRRPIPSEPYFDLPVSVFWVMRQIDEGLYEGRHIDWGAWALKMTGAQLQSLCAGLDCLVPGRVDSTGHCRTGPRGVLCTGCRGESVNLKSVARSCMHE
jgi:hypothetical protein